MLVFLDESGDAGLKLAAGSSPYFVVTLVIFENHDVANGVDRTVHRLREKFRFAPGFEFKFAKLDRKHREDFLKEINGFDFCYFRS